MFRTSHSGGREGFQHRRKSNSSGDECTLLHRFYDGNNFKLHGNDVLEILSVKNVVIDRAVSMQMSFVTVFDPIEVENMPHGPKTHQIQPRCI